jgi:hypothetical protein
MNKSLIIALLTTVQVTLACANEPVALYIFPAGGQRGTTVDARVGGLFFHGDAAFHLEGAGIEAPPRIRSTETIWFEGPVIPLPASQRAEDYPKDHACSLKIAADASAGVRYWRVATSQGLTAGMKFVVGELPEVVEQEVDGRPLPTPVTLPVTINGRIFPREDVDSWSIELAAGETVHCEVVSARLGYPLESRLEVLDPQGRRLAENSGHFGADAFLRFTAPAAGQYQVRIHDVSFNGLQHYVYRLTLTRGPQVDSVYPLGGRRGSALQLHLVGHGVPHEPVGIEIPADAPRDYAPRLRLSGHDIATPLLELDDLPEHLEAEPNEEASSDATQTVPAIFNGRIEAAGDVDCWAFTATKGQALSLDLRASRLGSPLDGVLTLFDSAGKQLAQADDLGGDQTDAALNFTAPADGIYHARVEERFASRGGPEFAYRLKVESAPPPDFEITLPGDALVVYRGAQANLKLAVTRSGGFAGAITLEAEGLPAGVTATGEVKAKQNQTQLAFKAEATAKVAWSAVSVRGKAEIGGQTVVRTASLATPRGEPPVALHVAVGMPTPFKVVGTYASVYAPRGSVHRRQYTIERGGYEGPLQIMLADRQARHLQGVTGPTITVPAGQSEFDYPVSLAPWLEVGRTSRTVLMAVGEVTDEHGTKHMVSQSTPGQSEQIVILADPGLLSVQPERTSVLAVPGGSAEVPVRIERARGVQSPVKLELSLPAHMAGITAEPVEVPVQASRGTLVLRFGQEIGPLNAPLTIRGIANDGHDPVVGEAKLEVVVN